MDDFSIAAQAGIKWALTILIALWAGLGDPTQALVKLMAVDVIAGVYVAYRTKTLSSKTMLRGLMGTKFLELAVLVVASQFEPFAPGIKLDLNGTTYALRDIVALALVAYEGVSILEHAAKGGAPVPQFLKDALEELRDQFDQITPGSD